MNVKAMYSLACVLLVASATFAADVMPVDDPGFANKIASGGMCEVKAGEIARSKSQNAKVKSFADTMITDHSKANAELQSLAEKKGWNLPKDVDEKHKAKLDSLQAAGPGDFDRLYMSMMVESHNKTAELLREATVAVKDSEFKTWLGKTLNTVEAHKGHAETLAQSLGVEVTRPVKTSFQETQGSAEGKQDSTRGSTKPSVQSDTNAGNNGALINGGGTRSEGTTKPSVQDDASRKSGSQSPASNVTGKSEGTTKPPVDNR